MPAERHPSARAALVVALFATAVGALLFGYKYLDLVARGYRTSWVVPFVEELSAAYATALLLFTGVLWLVRRYEPTRGALARTLVAHAAGVIAFSVLHTCLNWLSRSLVFAALGDRYDYGSMPTRFAMEFPMDFIVYSVFVIGWTLLERQRRARQRELEAARLEGRALDAELRNLRGQLEPHFLFNALNTISAVMYDDPSGADEMIGHLSGLLRASLKSGDAREVTLAAEVESVEHYLALLRARFGDRVRISLSVEPEIATALVPPIVLQPLVENAIRHGNAGAGRAATIAVSCVRAGTALEIAVYDDGPGMPKGADPFATGVGLGATRERLRLLYGDRQTIEAGNDAHGGFRIRLAIPFHVEAETARQPTIAAAR